MAKKKQTNKPILVLSVCERKKFPLDRRVSWV